jgi:hypothetical protein
MVLPEAEQISSLFLWSPVPTFRARADDLMQNVSYDELLVKSSETAKSLREAFILARFSAGIRASDCRLVDSQFPDAEIRTNEIVTKLEFTELMDSERKRGAESKSGNKAILIGDRVLKRNFELWIYWFVERVFKKTNHYNQAMNCDLVIYNNADLFRNLHELPRLHSLLAKELQTKQIGFERIWHFRPDKVHSIWPEIKEYVVPNWEQDL